MLINRLIRNLALSLLNYLLYLTEYWLNLIKYKVLWANSIHRGVFKYPVLYVNEKELSSRGGIIRGGEVKISLLSKAFKGSSKSFNLIYLVSSALQKDSIALALAAKSKGIVVVWNQNGVAYPSWAPKSYRYINNRLQTGMQTAECVIYQSRFCMDSTHLWVGKFQNETIIYNPVDTDIFYPGSSQLNEINLLLCGTQQAEYRVTSALDLLAELLNRRLRVKLTIAGKLNWLGAEASLREALRRMKLLDNVIRIDEFDRLAAPNIFRSATILLHTKYNDPCPTVVLEALATGVPVVCSDSGGLPELVDNSSGILIPVERGDYSRDHMIPATKGADAVLQIIDRYESYRDAARTIATERFSLTHWNHRHSELFQNLLANKAL